MAALVPKRTVSVRLSAGGYHCFSPLKTEETSRSTRQKRFLGDLAKRERGYTDAVITENSGHFPLLVAIVVSEGLDCVCSQCRPARHFRRRILTSMEWRGGTYFWMARCGCVPYCCCVSTTKWWTAGWGLLSRNMTDGWFQFLPAFVVWLRLHVFISVLGMSQPAVVQRWLRWN